VGRWAAHACCFARGLMGVRQGSSPGARRTADRLATAWSSPDAPRVGRHDGRRVSESVPSGLRSHCVHATPGARRRAERPPGQVVRASSRASARHPRPPAPAPPAAQARARTRAPGRLGAAGGRADRRSRWDRRPGGCRDGRRAGRARDRRSRLPCRPRRPRRRWTSAWRESSRDGGASPSTRRSFGSSPSGRPRGRSPRS
jgi:hypothetical protein